MAKITYIGDKEAILKKKREYDLIEKQLRWLTGKDREELNQWCHNQFDDLPPKAREGLKSLVSSLWSYLNLNNIQIGPSNSI